MGWLSSFFNGAKTVGSFSLNTLSYGAEQIAALRYAIPAINTQSVWNVFTGMGTIIVRDVAPVVILNGLNNMAQNYFCQDSDEIQQSMFTPIFLSTLTLVGYGIKLYTYRQIPVVLAHTFAIDTMGPSSFNEFKSALPLPSTNDKTALVVSHPTLCEEEHCNFKRKFKGSLRRVGTLVLDDIFLGIVRLLPFLGDKAAMLLGVYFYGEYIAYMSTPERCDRHKALSPDAVFSLGVSHAFNTYLMNIFLEYIGMPSYLFKNGTLNHMFFYHRAISHMLLLFEINIASHMSLPLVKSKENEMSRNPFTYYDNLKNLLVDTAISGLMKEIPNYFRPKTNPLIPLASLLKFLTRILDSDLEQEKIPVLETKVVRHTFFQRITQPENFKKAGTIAKTVVVQSTFHNSKNFVNDSVFKKFWPDIRNNLIYILDIVNSIKPVNTITTAPRPISSTAKIAIPKYLHSRFGLSIKFGEFLVSLSKKDEFWQFGKSLELWLKRHNISYDVKLAEDSVPQHYLHGSENNSTPLIKETDPTTQAPVAPAKELERNKPTNITEAGQLFPLRMIKKTKTAQASTLFPSPRKNNSIVNNDTKDTNGDNTSLLFNNI